jgi:DNA-binding IclR family transcriptional regulator
MSQFQSSIDNIGPQVLSRAPGKDPVVELGAGLEILEYLAAAKAPVTFTAIATDLGASNATLYRVLNVLEERGYVARSPRDKTYRSTGRLLQLEVAMVPAQRLIAHARPVMQALCESIGQSCNLSVPHSSRMIVIAQVASPAPLCISVPVGVKYDMDNSAPGQVYTAFSQASLSVSGERPLPSAVTNMIELGFSRAGNPSIPEVTDLSCPIFLNDQIAGALTVPYIKIVDGPSLGWCLAELQRAVEEVNGSLLNTTLVA